MRVWVDRVWGQGDVDAGLEDGRGEHEDEQEGRGRHRRAGVMLMSARAVWVWTRPLPERVEKAMARSSSFAPRCLRWDWGG